MATDTSCELDRVRVDHNIKTGTSCDRRAVRRRSNSYTLRNGSGDQKSYQRDNIENLHRGKVKRRKSIGIIEELKPRVLPLLWMVNFDMSVRINETR